MIQIPSCALVSQNQQATEQLGLATVCPPLYAGLHCRVAAGGGPAQLGRAKSMVKFSPKTAEITLAVQQQQTGDLGERAAPNTGCIVLIQYRDSLSPPLPSVARQNKQQVAMHT